ncbi:cysteine hydrolase family protein [Bradyrhizobium betae]|uniref:cysteine hydrolase family protein n=1 Tax=Bradyrhizobium betae TaxID=244734 RepID=UPI003D66F986
MTAPKTLLELSGADLNPPRLADSCLVLIDIQNEYRSGPLALPDAEPAIAVAAKLLARARQSGAAIFHIAHKGRAGSLFDREAERGAIVSSLTPLAGEPVIEKALPNAFAGTDLQARLAATGRTDIVLAGFMTHMCVSSTARAALDLGLRTTIAADACATRDLPDGRGGALSARTIHEVAMAELSDRFAIIAQGEALS